MAKHLESNDVKALDVIPYTDLRSKLKSGDLLFAAGDYLVSRAIRAVTNSPWSHVGVVLRVDKIDRILLLEAVSKNVMRVV